jgi:hypothetical protein
VFARKRGTTTRYTVTHPLLKDLLRVAKQILNARLGEAQSMLHELRSDTAPKRRPRPAAAG